MPDTDAPQVEPKTLTPPWAYYRRTGLSEMRPYVPGEDLTGISVSDPDKGLLAAAAESGENPGGYIARNPRNHADQWYVAQAYFDANFELVDVPVVPRDEAAELREENHTLRTEVDGLLKRVELLEAAIREWVEATDDAEMFELDQSNAYGTDHADAEHRVEAAAQALRRLAGGG